MKNIKLNNGVEMPILNFGIFQIPYPVFAADQGHAQRNAAANRQADYPVCR